MNSNHTIPGIKQLLAVVGRLYDDPLFRSGALQDPDLAFAEFDLSVAQQQALRSLTAKMQEDTPPSQGTVGLIWWWP